MEDFEFLLERALSCRNSGNIMEAKGLLEKAIQANPSEGEPYIVLADLYRQGQNPNSAIAYIKKSIAITPNDLRSLSILVNSLLGFGKIREATHIMQSLYSSDQKNLKYAEALAACYLFTPGRKSEKFLKDIIDGNTESRNIFLDAVKMIWKGGADLKLRFSDWQSCNLYASPVIETFYMRSTLAAQGFCCEREDGANALPALTLSSLSRYGRFTHTVQNYLATRIYAARHGFQVQTPEWSGHYFFELNDPFISQSQHRFNVQVPTVLSDAISLGTTVPAIFNKSSSYDLFSPYANVFRRVYKDEVLSLLKIHSHWVDKFDKLLSWIRCNGATIISLHIRLGDMERLGSAYGAIHYSAYLNWLSENWHRFDRPILYIASDDPEKAKIVFHEFLPITLNDYPERDPVISGLQDFYVLTRSDIVAISRGGFGHTAAALNQKGHQFLRPTKNGDALEVFAPWGD